MFFRGTFNNNSTRKTLRASRTIKLRLLRVVDPMMLDAEL
jgi:hypothetical protein